MENMLEELIEKYSGMSERDERMQQLIDDLKKKRDELGEDAPKEQTDKAARQLLVRYGMSEEDSPEESFTLSDEEQEFLSETAGTVRDYFDGKKWAYRERSINAGMIMYELVFVIDDRANFNARVYIEANPRVCRIDVIFPLQADKTYEYVLCKSLEKENYNRRFGAFVYNDETGEVKSQYSFMILNGLDSEEFDVAFGTQISSMAQQYKNIQDHCIGKFRQKETREILNNIEKLMDDLTDDGD